MSIRQNVVTNGTFTGSANGWYFGAGWVMPLTGLNGAAATTTGLSELSFDRNILQE